MTPEEKMTIEAVVNSQEAVDMVTPSFSDGWKSVLDQIEKRIGPLSSEELKNLGADLYDWWKNGNFRVWGEDEKNSFGMTKWELGDPDFWPQDPILMVVK